MYKLNANDAQSIRALFVCMRDEYHWSDNRPDVPDARVVAKANEEYHGFQRYAGQYASQAMYKEAAQHFNEAAELRANIMKALPQLKDPNHEKAVLMCQRFANYYAALDQWQQLRPVDYSKIPKPEAFGLNKEVIDKLEKEGQQQLNAAPHRGL